MKSAAAVSQQPVHLLMLHVSLLRDNGELRCKTAQGSTARGSTAQHSTAQHSTAQHSTAQHSTAQHSIL